MSPVKNYATGEFQFQESLSLLTKTLAIALRGRVLLLAGLGVLLVWLIDAPLVDALPKPEPMGESVVALFASASWFEVQSIYLGFVDPFLQIARGEFVLMNLLRCLVRIAVWGLIGGAIVRIAVLNLTRGENPELWGSLRYVWQHKVNLLGGPGVMIAGLLVVALPLLAAKLLMHVSWLAPILSLLWILVMAIMVVAVVYAIGALTGWPIMIAAAAADRSDAFDAVSRVYAYVYQKPLRLVAYLMFALPMMIAAALLSMLFTSMVVQLCGNLASGSTSSFTAEAINWWSSMATSLVTVYLTSLFWTTSTGIYLLRRRDVDSVPTDEVFIDPSEYQGKIESLKPATSRQAADEECPAEAA